MFSKALIKKPKTKNNNLKQIAVIVFVLFTTHIKAQNLFPVKLDNCKFEMFCLDCGDIKADIDQKEFEKLEKKLDRSLSLLGVAGKVMFQVLVDSNGRGCVISHTDKSNSAITRKIIKELNKSKNWTPAITDGKKEERSSINLAIHIEDFRVTGKVERVDNKAIMKSFDRPMDPEYVNTSYEYKNESLPNYKITVWNSKNSNLPGNWNYNITIDKSGLIWLTGDDRLLTFDGKEFIKTEPNIVGTKGNSKYYDIETDNNDVKWVRGNKKIYCFDNVIWKALDSVEIGFDRALKIVNNPKTGEVFFCTNNGLIIKKEGKWITLDKKMLPELPNDTIQFAKRDTKNRIWIGTYSGTVMIDENNKITNFENTTSYLKGKCITSMEEDENGNLYFTLNQFFKNAKYTSLKAEGVLCINKDGIMKQFTIENSAIPTNYVNSILYDKNEKVLWLISHKAGLIRYDLKGSWEIYHNLNSNIPTSYISAMSFDKNGNLFLATRQGLVKVERK